ncbi:hypothetical protein [Alienimonas sp. DA493]|uniref:hypothetical protein n=1 Tax=Alienimonas sp. DA493 TaxID=3373605 RepID=UPI0037548991
MSEQQLAEAIIALSHADDWEEAKREWSLAKVYEAEEPETCLCGKYPILEICILHNRLNHELATVGNHCVKKFLELESDKIFSAIKRVRRENKRALNAEAVEYGHNKGWINAWERSFYLDTMRKRNLSEKQRAKRVQINEKFSANLKESGSRS